MNSNDMIKLLANFYNHSRKDPNIFLSAEFQKFNEQIYELALMGLGYNNYQDSNLTGEDFFLRHIVSRVEVGVCFDVGANVGAWSRHIKMIHPLAKLHAFEPLPDVFQILSDDFSNSSNTFLNKIALGGTVGRSVIFHGRERTHASLSSEIENIDYINNDRELIVDVMTIDQYCNLNNVTNIDLLKIDVEGFEEKVIKGGLKTLLRSPPKLIQIEFNRHHLYEHFTIYSIKRLLADNYRIFQLMPGGWLERDFDSPRSNIFEYANFVLVRNDICEEIIK